MKTVVKTSMAMESVAPIGQLRACMNSFLIRLPRSSVLLPPSRSEMKNSPIDGTNTSTHPATMPGTVSGTVTVQNALKGEAPRSREASITVQSSFSTEL